MIGVVVLEFLRKAFRTPKTWLYLAIAAVCILCLLSMRECADRGRELQIAAQNQAALLDSTRMVRNLAGDLEAERTLLVADRDKLRQLNGTLADALDKERGIVKAIQKTTMRIIRDTISVANTVEKLNDSTYLLQWAIDTSGDEWSRRLAGSSGFSLTKGAIAAGRTTILSDEMAMTLYTGIREEDGLLKIFARTNHPGVAFTIEGAVIDPEKSGLLDSFVRKKHWSIGPFIGGGYAEDGMIHGMVGIGLQYSIISF